MTERTLSKEDLKKPAAYYRELGEQAYHPEEKLRYLEMAAIGGDKQAQKQLFCLAKEYLSVGKYSDKLCQLSTLYYISCNLYGWGVPKKITLDDAEELLLELEHECDDNLYVDSYLSVYNDTKHDEKIAKALDAISVKQSQFGKKSLFVSGLFSCFKPRVSDDESGMTRRLLPPK